MSPEEKRKPKSLQDNLGKSRFVGGYEPSVCVCGYQLQMVMSFLQHVFACKVLMRRQQYPRPANHTAKCHYRAAVLGKVRTGTCRHGFGGCPVCDPCNCGFR